MTRPIPVAHVRPTHLILRELAELSRRRSEVEAEFAEALAAPPAPAVPEPSAYLTTREAAALLGVSTRHLETLRAEGRGPAYTRVGRSIRYAREALCGASVKTRG